MVETLRENWIVVLLGLTYPVWIYYTSLWISMAWHKAKLTTSLNFVENPRKL